MELVYLKNKNDNYNIVDDVIFNEFSISSRLRLKLIKNNKIFLNNIVSDTRNEIKPNDKITINLDFEEESSNIIPTKMNLDIMYEDDWILVVNKPAGIPVHPSILHYEDSLSNGIKYYFNSISLKKKIRPVNRLDLNTSGLVVFAKCEYIQESLSNQMKNNIFKKEYLALAYGIFNKKQGTINLPIARKENSIIERCIDETGQKSITHYEVLDEFENYSLVKCILETGRTHQIRVHMAAINHPLLGDTLYGNSSKFISRQALHCYKLSFIHPVTKKKISISCPIPNDMKINNQLKNINIQI